jgi:glycosyltransferase involved in cell wall biosynthesis
VKVLYVGRIFSGLESSLVNRTWSPTGVPTIHKVIERLDRDTNLHLIFADKDDTRLWRESGDRDITVEGLRAPVRVLAGSAALSFGGPFKGWLREFRQTFAVLSVARKLQPDIIYVDHGNAIAGAVLARFFGWPLVFRIMGVYPAMWTALRSGRIANRVLRWAYRSPFALVICTEDGSGGPAWLKQAIRPGVRTEVLLNGVDVLADDAPVNLPAIPPGRLVVLYVGKLEVAKGCGTFMTGFIAAQREAPGKLHALVIGAGREGDCLKRQAQEAGAAEAVTFLERVPHREILAIQKSADVYVSLNRLGNLSNANLEAMRMGACMVMPDYLPDVGVNDPTKRLLPEQSYLRIRDPDAVDDLAALLLKLLNDSDLRRTTSEAMKAVATRLLTTWDDRVDREVKMLFALAPGAPPDKPAETHFS